MPEPVSSPLRILIAEDSPDNLVLLRAYLKNTSLVLEQFMRASFDLILMDMQMPLLDGLAATRRIRVIECECGLSATPVVALTAHALETHRVQPPRRLQRASFEAHLDTNAAHGHCPLRAASRSPGESRSQPD